MFFLLVGFSFFGVGSSQENHLLWRSQFPLVEQQHHSVADFAIIDKEGWTEESYMKNDYGAAPRQEVSGERRYRCAVAMVAAGKSGYKQLAIAVARSVREKGFDGDVVVYLGEENRETDGCVASQLRKMGVLVRPFRSLLADFPYPKAKDRSPAWHKLGIAWNAELRENYDRVLYFDTDQYVDINVTQLLYRDLPETTVIAMCPCQCTRVAVAGGDAFNLKFKRSECDIKCARGETPRPPASKIFPEACDNIGFGNRQALKRSGKMKEFWTHFPRKALSYQSGLFLLDLTKLPSLAVTKKSAQNIFEHFPAVWNAFGDQEFFNNLFYDSVSILPECMLQPPVFRHIFHNNVDSAVKGRTSFRSAKLYHNDTSSEFQDLYHRATGLDAVCKGPPTDDFFTKNGTFFVQKQRTVKESFAPESIVCQGHGCLRPIELVSSKQQFNQTQRIVASVLRKQRPLTKDESCDAQSQDEVFFLERILPFYTKNSSFFVDVGESRYTSYLERCRRWTGLVVEKEFPNFESLRRRRPNAIAVKAARCQKRGPLKQKKKTGAPSFFCEPIADYFDLLAVHKIALLSVQIDALSVLRAIDFDRVHVAVVAIYDDPAVKAYLEQRIGFTFAARHCSSSPPCLAFFYNGAAKHSHFNATAFLNNNNNK